MAFQHRELHYRLKDAKKLWFYARSTASKHHALEDGLGKAKAKSKHWKQKAKEGIERATTTGNERDEAKEEAQAARLATIAATDAKAWAENELPRVQEVLAVAEEAKRRAEVETSRLKIERTSLLLEIGVEKDEPLVLGRQRQRSHGGGLPKGFRADLCL